MADGRHHRRGRPRARRTTAVLVALAVLAGCAPGDGLLSWDQPSADALALADDLGLTEDGRALFLAHHPALVGQPEVEDACLDAGVDGIQGCYVSGDAPAILLVDRPDELGHDAMLATAAWGLLMAAYERIDTFDRPGVDALVQAGIDALPPDHAVRATLAASPAQDPLTTRAQAFAVLGSTLVDPLDPALEQQYARWLTDRTAVVTRAQTVAAQLEATAAELAVAWADQVATEQANAAARDQLAADRRSLDQARQRYNAAVEEYNAMTPEQRAGSSSSWTLWDGTQIPMQPMGDALAAVRSHLEAAPAQLDARQAALDQADAEASAARVALEARQADLDAVLPTPTTP